MTKAHWTLAALLALALVGNAKLGVDAKYARGEADRYRRTVDSLERAVARVDTVYATVARDVVRRVTRIDTLTVSVDRWKHDTLRVVEYVTQADSLARACTAALLSCDERVRLRDARFAAEEAQHRAEVAVWRSKVPSRLERLRGAALWAGAGWLAGKLDLP